MSTNASPEFVKAEKEFLEAETEEEKLTCLEKMLSTMPAHKGAESLRANLRTRYKRLKEKINKEAKLKKQTRGKEGIKKQGIQVLFCGLTNSGKSSLLTRLTNATPLIANYEFTTKYPSIGSLDYEGLKFQIIDMPAINHENFEQGLISTADILLLIITKLSNLEEIIPFLEKSKGKRIIVFNKMDLLNENEKRKIEATLRSKKYNFILVSAKTGENIEELKKKLLENSGVIRIYTKQPGKPADKDPVILKPNSTVKIAAKKIFHSSVKVKEIRITGPSSKFSNQKVGPSHVLKDKDILEFKVD